MFSHFLKITFRNLSRSKLYSFINIFGLSIGIACAVLIVLFIKDELTFDRHHVNADRLFRLYYEAERMDGSLAVSPMVPIIMGEEVAANYPDITAKSVWYQFDADIRKAEQWLTESLHMVDSSFLRMFTVNTLEGSIDRALSDPSDILITRSMASRYFGDQPAVGQSLTIALGAEPEIFVVKAVVADPPPNASHRFDFLISSLKGKDLLTEDMRTSWNLVASETYVMLREGSSASEIDFAPLVARALGEDLEGRSFKIGLQPLTAMHLDNDMPQGMAPVSDPRYTFILTAICILVLAMASVNFMNLSLGRSFGRAREIGVKKVVGADRKQLVFQFLGEAVMMSLISLVVGLAIAYVTLPLFNTLSGKELDVLFSVDNILMFAALSILVGLLAGLYPAAVLSGFRPARIIKGNFIISRGGGKIRQGMIVFQLVLSVFLITTVLFMKEQLNFMQEKNLGFSKEQLAVIPLSVPEARGFVEVIELGWTKAERGQQYFNGLPGIENIAISTQNFEGANWMRGGYLDANQTMQSFYFNLVDANFIPALDISVIEGRNFRESDPADQRRAVIVNEAFVREFGLKDPVGSSIPHQNFPDHEIIGVLKDFNYASLHAPIEPLVLAINPMIILEGINDLNINSSVEPKLMVKLAAGQVSSGIAAIEDAWEKVYGEERFMPTFVDETIQAQYEQERNLNTIVLAATVISILIGSLGLFGLATLTMNARRKEMGIRKVLGANMNSMVLELSRSYLVLVLIAIFLSLPLTYLFVQDWLSNFEFRIEISAVTYMLGGLILILISVLILTYQSMRVAKADPVHALRSE